MQPSKVPNILCVLSLLFAGIGMAASSQCNVKERQIIGAKTASLYRKELSTGKVVVSYHNKPNIIKDLTSEQREFRTKQLAAYHANIHASGKRTRIGKWSQQFDTIEETTCCIKEDTTCIKQDTTELKKGLAELKAELQLYRTEVKQNTQPNPNQINLVQQLMQSSAHTLKQMCKNAGLNTKNLKFENAKLLSKLGAATCYGMLNKNNRSSPKAKAKAKGQKRSRDEFEQEANQARLEASCSSSSNQKKEDAAPSNPPAQKLDLEAELEAVCDIEAQKMQSEKTTPAANKIPDAEEVKARLSKVINQKSMKEQAKAVRAAKGPGKHWKWVLTFRDQIVAKDFKQNEPVADTDQMSDKEALALFKAMQQDLLAGDPEAQAMAKLVCEQCSSGSSDLIKARAFVGLRCKSTAV